MEQIELIKILMKNTYINFLLGAGTSYNVVEGKKHFPLMSDLLLYIRTNQQVLDFYDGLIKDTSLPSGMTEMLVGLYDTYLFAEGANVEKFLSVLEGVDLYITETSFKERVIEQRNLIRMLIRNRLKEADVNTVLDTYQFL